MRLSTTLLIVALASLYVASVGWAEPQITRQRCDEMLAKLAPDPWLASKDASTLAWNESYNLSALLDLYAATKDRKYLDELIQRADQELSHRDDKRNFEDASGKVHKRWSIDSKYTMAEVTLVDDAGNAVIKLQSTAYANNHATKLRVTRDGDQFTVKVENNVWKREETFENLSMDSSSDRYFTKVINREEPLPKPPPGTATEESHLIRAEAIGEKPAAPKAQNLALKPLWHAHVGYVGIIYQPILEFAKLVKSDSSLRDLGPAANRFIAAAEESYADLTEMWRDGPGKDEGYYLGCDRGGASPYDNLGEPFNYLAKHASSELILFQLTGKPQYREQLTRMAKLFKNRLQTDPAGAYVWHYWYEPVTTGWKKEDSISAHYPTYEGYAAIEDVSHGTLDIGMVLALHHEKIVFDYEDMRRFTKTFMKNVLREDRRGFNAKVDGSRGDAKYEDTTVFGWLPLAEVEPKVYDACREVYLHHGKEDFKSAARLLKWEAALGGR